MRTDRSEQGSFGYHKVPVKWQSYLAVGLIAIFNLISLPASSRGAILLDLKGCLFLLFYQVYEVF